MLLEKMSTIINALRQMERQKQIACQLLRTITLIVH